MVAPLAPHIAAELWERLGHDDPIDDVAFPLPDADALVRAALVLPVTVDGRRRGEITVSVTPARTRCAGRRWRWGLSRGLSTRTGWPG